MNNRAPYRKPASAFGAKDQSEWQAKILSQGRWKKSFDCKHRQAGVNPSMLPDALARDTCQKLQQKHRGDATTKIQCKKYEKDLLCEECRSSEYACSECDTAGSIALCPRADVREYKYRSKLGKLLRLQCKSKLQRMTWLRRIERDGFSKQAKNNHQTRGDPLQCR
eukprot:2637462-Karenia_brevis.AAC.1